MSYDSVVTALLALGILAATLGGLAGQDAVWMVDVEKQVAQFSKVLGIPAPPVKLMDAPRDVLAEFDGGTILLNREAAKTAFSREELSAALARETICLARLPREKPASSTLAMNQLSGGMWFHRETRIALAGEMVDLLLACEHQPLALLTLFEVEFHRIGAFGRGLYSEYGGMILDLRERLAVRGIPIYRSSVSLEFRVTERVDGERVVFALFGRDLLRLSLAEANEQRGVAQALNAFMDRQGQAFEVSARGSELVLSGESVVSLESAEVATEVVRAIRKALSEYALRLPPLGLLHRPDPQREGREGYSCSMEMVFD